MTARIAYPPNALLFTHPYKTDDGHFQWIGTDPEGAADHFYAWPNVPAGWAERARYPGALDPRWVRAPNAKGEYSQWPGAIPQAPRPVGRPPGPPKPPKVPRAPAERLEHVTLSFRIAELVAVAGLAAARGMLSRDWIVALVRERLAVDRDLKPEKTIGRCVECGIELTPKNIADAPCSSGWAHRTKPPATIAAADA